MNTDVSEIQPVKYSQQPNSQQSNSQQSHSQQSNSQQSNSPEIIPNMSVAWRHISLILGM